MLRCLKYSHSDNWALREFELSQVAQSSTYTLNCSIIFVIVILQPVDEIFAWFVGTLPVARMCVQCS